MSGTNWPAVGVAAGATCSDRSAAVLVILKVIVCILSLTQGKVPLFMELDGHSSDSSLPVGFCRRQGNGLARKSNEYPVSIFVWRIARHHVRSARLCDGSGVPCEGAI